MFKRSREGIKKHKEKLLPICSFVALDLTLTTTFSSLFNDNVLGATIAILIPVIIKVSSDFTSGEAYENFQKDWIELNPWIHISIVVGTIVWHFHKLFEIGIQRRQTK